MKKVIEELYDEGRFGEALDLIALTYSSPHGMPDEILPMAGWCLYRCQEYEKADGAGVILCERGILAGFEIRAQIAAYITKNDKLLEELYSENPDNPSIANAVTIRARDDDSNIPTDTVLCIARKFIGDNRIASAHIINNAARLVSKRNSSKSFSQALESIALREIALKKYGRKNYHHRAAAQFWMSHDYTTIGEKKLAFKSAQKSTGLWMKAISLDPKNSGFQKALAGAQERLTETLKELR